MTHTLYVVDDDPQVSTLLGRVAELAGWSPVICRNGQELMEKLSAETTPALVLLDILMPEMDGIETAKALASSDRCLTVRFVTGGSVSNAQAAEYISKARGLRLGETILKPFSVQGLTEDLKLQREQIFPDSNEKLG